MSNAPGLDSTRNSKVQPPHILFEGHKRSLGVLYRVVGDLNGESQPDLAVENRGGNTVSVLLHSGCQR